MGRCRTSRAEAQSPCKERSGSRLIPDVLYVRGVRANTVRRPAKGEWREAAGGQRWDVARLGCGRGARATYTGRVLCIDLRPRSAESATPTTEVVAMRAIVSASKSTPDRLHARLAHVGMDTIRSSAKHEVATGLDLKCGSDADDVLAVVHIDLCGPFRVAAKDGSLYFLLLKDRKTRYVWVRPVAKKSDVLQEFV
ncbi:unnamed protein product [Closterium sp. NIES-53]